MNGNTESEQDLELKLRMMRYLWHLGYYVRKDVAVQEIWQEEKTRYTDIDVLGIKVDDELNAHLILCDCKSGTTDKTHERLFWLSGVMKYFKTERAYFLRTKMASSRYIELADSLGISLISEDQFSSLEKSYDIGKAAFGPFCAEHVNADRILRFLKEKDRQTYHYVETGYWKDPPQRQILSIISCCKMIDRMEDIEKERLHFLLSYMLSALSLSILRFAQRVLTVADDEKSDFVRLSLMGGRIEYEEKRALLGSFYGFMTQEIEERYHAKYPVSSTQFRDSLMPEYSKYLVDLVARICQKPRRYIIAPRVLSLLAFESILNSRKLQTDFLKPSSLDFDVSQALTSAEDFLIFAQRGGFVKDETSKILVEKLFE